MQQVIDAYHGTTTAAATKVIAGERFVLSRNNYDWLGDGIYFWQDAPRRALDWARSIHGADAAVIAARVELADCIDLLDVGWSTFLAEAHDLMIETYRRTGIPTPAQRGGAHRLDRAVLNYAVEVLEARGMRVRTIRAAFNEGAPAYPGSDLFQLSHVQVAVRDQELVTSLKLLEEDQIP
jgi:GNAT superfamily N-acetyltransferase